MAIGRASLILLIGTGTATGLNFLAVPILARLTSPAEFGVFALFVGVAAVATNFAGMRYDTAIVHPNDQARAHTLLLLALLSSILTTAIALCAGALIWLLPSDFGLSHWAGQLALPLATVIFFNAIQRIATEWLTRTERFLGVGILPPLLAGSTLALQWWLIDAPHESLVEGPARRAVTLAWGAALGQTLTGIAAFAMTAPAFYAAFRTRARAPIRSTAVEYRDFPRYMIPYGLSTLLRDRSVQFAIGAIGSAEVLGRFAMAQRICAAPLGLVHAGVAQPLYGFACRHGKRASSKLGASVLELASALIFPFAILLIPFADPVAQLFLGNRWRGAGFELSVLAVPYALLAAVCFCDRFFIAFGEQRTILILDVCCTVVILTTTSLALGFVSERAGIVTYAVVMSGYFIYWLRACWLKCGLTFADLHRPAAIAIAAAAVGLAAGAFRLLNLDWPFTLALGSAFCVAWFAVYLWRLGGIERMGELLRVRSD